MIRCIEFENVGPFRGKHVIKLDACAYAIVAHHELNPKKSNAIGKSFLFDAINLAVTGTLPAHRRERGWITEGEKSGRIKLTFDDAWIERSKEGSQSVQLRFAKDGSKPASQDDAQAAIFKWLGFNKNDFTNVAFFEQKKMARLVDAELTGPSDRVEIVSGWLGLGLAERAEESAGDLASTEERELTKLVAKRTLLKEMLDKPVTDASLIEQAREHVKGHEHRIDQLNEMLATFKTLERARKIIKEHDALIEEGTALRAKVDASEIASAEIEAVGEELANLRAAALSATEEASAAKRVAFGLFDGRCPVASITCPVKDKINEDRKATKKRYEEAKAKQDAAHAAFEAKDEEARPLIAKFKEIEKQRAKLEDLRARVRAGAGTYEAAKKERKECKKLLKEHAPDETPEQLEADLRERQSLIRELEAAIGGYEQIVKQRAEHEEQLAKLEGEIEAQKKKVNRALKARAIFRMGQRNVAERELTRVEEDANRMLYEANIDLRVGVRWEREAKGVAKSCDECGAAFPQSAKVKICERCGAPRGAHTVQRLDFTLSDRSGAFDDLGGMTLQLAAGSWLLGERHSPWSTAMIDEPFGACDQHNRRGLAVQLLKLLSRGAWRQSMIVSHSPDTVEMFPNRINIVALADGSRRIEVT